MSESSEITHNQEQEPSKLEVIRLTEVQEWRDLLSDYEERGKEIIYSDMNTYDVFNENQVIVNKGAAPCALEVVYEESTNTTGVGHYIVGNGNYDEFMEWTSQLENPEIYLFGQSFPPAPHSSSDIYMMRKQAIDDLKNAGASKLQIYDYRESDYRVSGTDNVIIDTEDKKIYFYRTKKK